MRNPTRAEMNCHVWVRWDGMAGFFVRLEALRYLSSLRRFAEIILLKLLGYKCTSNALDGESSSSFHLEVMVNKCCKVHLAMVLGCAPLTPLQSRQELPRNQTHSAAALGHDRKGVTRRDKAQEFE